MSGLTDAERHPMLGGDGRRLLRSVLEDPHAPRWNHMCGERLDAEGLAGVARFAEAVRSRPPQWAWGEEPPWVARLVDHCLTSVPAYRHLGGGSPSPGAVPPLRELPALTRSELAAAPWRFVPDGEPLDDLTVHATSGTGGRPMPVLQRPAVVASYYPLVQAMLEAHGADPRAAAGRRLGWLTVAHQASTYVLASVSAWLGGTCTGKVNLHPDAWRDADDRRPFLESCDPAVVTGDPVALAALDDLATDLHPVALVSSATALAPALAARLRRRLGCPVIDVYSAAETGPVACSLPEGGGLALVQPQLYVEVLDRTGERCPPGERGEVTVTGGFNPLLPLLRYRTGDFAAMTWHGRRPVLSGLEGRPPVVLLTSGGTRVNTVDVSKVLGGLELARWSVHQRRDRSVVVRVPAPEGGEGAAARAAVAGVMGHGTVVAVAGFSSDDKVAAFTSDLPDLPDLERGTDRGSESGS